MADLTSIEWCDATLNLWWGCTKVSEGCKFCYAEHLADHRYHKGNWGPKGTRQEVKSWKSTLNEISKRSKKEGRRFRVFCQSMSDTFEGPETMGGEDSENWIRVSSLREQLLKAIVDHPELDFLVLTKRPQNVTRWGATMMECVMEGFPPNFWIGTSVEDQKTAEERIPHLLKIPAKVRFLSCEPLLGQVILGLDVCWSCGSCLVTGNCICDYPARINWVICGGESGLNARPMNPYWARSLRDQCQAAGVAFHFKQWGEWIHEDQIPEDEKPTSGPYVGDGPVLYRVGKHNAGRLLDGRAWDEYPEVQS